MFRSLFRRFCLCSSTNPLRLNVPVKHFQFFGAYPENFRNFKSTKFRKFLVSSDPCPPFQPLQNEHLLCLLNKAQKLHCWKLIERIKECNRIASFFKVKKSRRCVWRNRYRNLVSIPVIIICNLRYVHLYVDFDVGWTLLKLDISKSCSLRYSRMYI